MSNEDKAVLLEEESISPQYPDPVAPPPPYGYSPQYAKQSSNLDRHVKIVTAQPGATVGGTIYYRPPSDNFFILSIFLTVFCCACGSWIAMCCTIPAIIFAVHARDAESRGATEEMRSKRTTALVLNIVGFVVGLVATIASWIWMYYYYKNHFGEDNDEHDDDHHHGDDD